MDEVKNKKAILDTIDQLRGRKARPDLKGICHMLERKHRLGAAEVTRDLERLCEHKIVIKQDYKGRISYRNAAKWRRSHEYGGVVGGSLEPDDGAAAGELLVRAIKELTKEARGAGCTLSQVDDWMRRQQQHSGGGAALLTLEELEMALESECASGSIKRTPSGNYCRGDRKRQPPTPGGGSSCVGPGATSSDDDVRRGRLASKRKHVGKSQRSDANSHNGGGASAARDDRCDYCLLSAQANKKGQAEKLLFCKDCSAMAHPSCMNYSVQLSRRAQMSPWQCIDCKTCCICQNADDPDSMLFCDACDKGYHMSCHHPAVLDKPKGKWACHRCQEDGLEPGGQSGEASPRALADTASGEGNDSSGSSTVDSDEVLRSPEQADENSNAADDVATAAAAVTTTAPAVTSTDVPAAATKRIAASANDLPSAKRIRIDEKASEIGGDKEAAAESSKALPPPPPPALLQHAVHEALVSSAQKAGPANSPRSDVGRSLYPPRSPPSTTKQASPVSGSSSSSGINGPVPLPHQFSTNQQRAMPPLKQPSPLKQQVSPPKQQPPRVSPPPPPPQQKVSPLQLVSAPPMQQLAVPTQPSSKLQAPMQSPRQHGPPLVTPRHQGPAPSPRQQAPPSPSARQPAQLPLSSRQSPAVHSRLQQPPPSRPHALPLSSPVQPRQQPLMQLHDEPSKDKVAVSCRYVNIPPSEWTVADVVQYFKNCGFYQESEKFLEQEIDGKSLLLLMRNDVLANMALTLGSALKIYERVKVLQACGSSKCLQQVTNGQR